MNLKYDPALRDLPERWGNVPGYGDRYQASTHGRVRRVERDGRMTVMPTYLNKKSVCVALWDPRINRQRSLTVQRVVYETWLGTVPPGGVVYHYNGMQTDNAPDNLRLTTRMDWLQRHNKGMNRRPVAMVDADGEPVAFYPSVVAAARANHIHYTCVIRYCTGETQKPFDDEGHRFRYDDVQKRGRKGK